MGMKDNPRMANGRRAAINAVLPQGRAQLRDQRGPGAGKTYAAAMIAQELIEKDMMRPRQSSSPPARRSSHSGQTCSAKWQSGR